MERYLTIMEVSQKQAYIFGSNKLRDNVTKSANIAWILDDEYFKEANEKNQIYDTEKNLVYSGGGHTVLEFDSKETADQFVSTITTKIYDEYPDVALFVKTIKYDENKDAGSNLKLLTAELEKKKAVRRNAFHQGSFGIEQIDSNTLAPIRVDSIKEMDIPSKEKSIEEDLFPEGYQCAIKFGELGGSKEESNFIAVIHIDGNAMGKRIEEIYEKNKSLSWDEYKKNIKNFSESIDKDFKSAFKDMMESVAENLKNEKLNELQLKNGNFPVRRIITAGDDICFVTEGRIGIECAVKFIQMLEKKKNVVDNQGYSACAGVAIVHQKYPFFRAYELAEMLCSNAKRFGASMTEDGLGKDISSIDWHIEFGEIGDNVNSIRKNYCTVDNKQLEMRPYIISCTEAIEKLEPMRKYDNFRKLMHEIQNSEIAYARGKMKELREVLKQGEDKTKYYLRFNKMDKIAMESYQGIYKKLDMENCFNEKMDGKIFLKTYDGKERSILFDVIELIDTYLQLD